MPRRLRLDIELGNSAMRTVLQVSHTLVKVANRIRDLGRIRARSADGK